MIEFVICLPVLIILLYYVNDLSILKRYYDQTEFIAQQVVNIIQNISQNRSDKAITCKDIMHAASLAYLTIYPGKTMYKISNASGSSHKLSHAPHVNIFYVRGLAGGKASCLWNIAFVGESAYNPMSWEVHFNEDYYSSGATSVRLGTNVDQSSIHKSLKINEGEEKVIVEVNIFNASHMVNAKIGAGKQGNLAKKAFNCFIATPKPLLKNSTSTQGWYFSAVEIFSPNLGLFDPDNPPKND